MVYKGYASGKVFVENPGICGILALNPRTDLSNHSPTGFAWGYGGSGPAQLALAILAEHLKWQPPERIEELKNQAGFRDYKLEEHPPSMEQITWPEWLAVRYHQDFKFAVIGNLPQSAPFTLTSEQVDAALERILHERGQGHG